MPRSSDRKRLLKVLEREVIRRNEAAYIRERDAALAAELRNEFGVGLPSGAESTGSYEEMVDMAVYAAFESVSNERYVRSRKKYRSSTGVSVFEKDLIEDDAEDGTPPWLTQEEFLEKYHVHRDSFHLLVDKIRDHSVFQSLHGKSKQKPVAFQLMVFLFYVGTSGSGSSNPRLRSMFGIGRGTAELYKRRCVKAIRSLRPDAISWPDETEREEIAKRVMAEYGWLQCIAVADGTLFPLTYAPQSKDAPDYHGRKHMYSLSVMIVNDDQRKIRAYMSGHPGSCHDSRVYGAMPLATDPESFFSGQKYFLLGDSAFANSESVVTSFKAPRGHALTPEQEAFNTKVGNLRVTSEHTIGMLKARFPFLRSIPMKITDDPKSLRRILRVIDCCIILHNLLIDIDDDVPEEWWESDVNDGDIATAVGEPNFSAPFFPHSPNDERRQRCFDYFQNLRGPPSGMMTTVTTTADTI